MKDSEAQAQQELERQQNERELRAEVYAKQLDMALNIEHEQKRLNDELAENTD